MRDNVVLANAATVSIPAACRRFNVILADIGDQTEVIAFLKKLLRICRPTAVFSRKRRIGNLLRIEPPVEVEKGAFERQVVVVIILGAQGEDVGVPRGGFHAQHDVDVIG